MNCNKCGKPMLALFTSFVCNTCNPVVSELSFSTTKAIRTRHPSPPDILLFVSLTPAEWGRLSDPMGFPRVCALEPPTAHSGKIYRVAPVARRGSPGAGAYRLFLTQEAAKKVQGYFTAYIWDAYLP